MVMSEVSKNIIFPSAGSPFASKLCLHHHQYPLAHNSRHGSRSILRRLHNLTSCSNRVLPPDGAHLIARGMGVGASCFVHM